MLRFPVLAKEPSELKSILAAGLNDDNTSRRRQFLPWQAKNFDRRRLLPKRAPIPCLSMERQVSSGGSSVTSDDRADYAKTSVSGGRGGNDLGGGWKGIDHSIDASSTSKKTIESLSASVYHDLEPFRLTHQNLIKNRMMLKRTRRRCRATRAGGENSSKGSKRRRKDPLDTGLEKITLVASSFAWAHGKQCTRGIQRRGLLPTEFKEQLQMALHIFLRPSEAAAIAEFFDPNGTGSVNGEYFVRWFLHSGNRYREARLARQAADRLEEQRQQREKQREERAKRDAANRAIVEVEFSKEDENEALSVLGKVALSYHDQRTGRDAAQQEFACALEPHDFREQLLLSLGVRLTDRQFSALFHMMDINGDRYIDGAEFLHFFFGLANTERAKEQRQHEANCHIRARNLRLDMLPPLAPTLGR